MAHSVVHQIVQQYERSLGADVEMHPAEVYEVEWIGRCGTGELGVMRRECKEDGHFVDEVGLPCKKRLCTRCAGRMIWAFVAAFLRLMLPCPAHQVVVTLWASLRPVWECNRRLITDLMFETGSRVLLDLMADGRHLGGMPGIVGVLHTAGKGQVLHIHIHFVVTAGGLGADGKWIACRPGWLISKKAFRELYRGRFIAALSEACKKNALYLPAGMTAPKFFELLEQLRHRKWNVHIGRRKSDPTPLIKYVASRLYGGPVRDHQIVSTRDGQVTFYTERSKKKLAKWLELGIRPETCTLPIAKFVRGILQHWLPKHTRALRYYGLYAPRRRALLERARAAIVGHSCETAPPVTSPTTDCCPKCQQPLIVTRSKVVPWTRRRSIRKPTRPPAHAPPPGIAA